MQDLGVGPPTHSRPLFLSLPTPTPEFSYSLAYHGTSDSTVFVSPTFLTKSTYALLFAGYNGKVATGTEKKKNERKCKRIPALYQEKAQ